MIITLDSTSLNQIFLKIEALIKNSLIDNSLNLIDDKSRLTYHDYALLYEIYQMLFELA